MAVIVLGVCVLKQRPCERTLEHATTVGQEGNEWAARSKKPGLAHFLLLSLNTCAWTLYKDRKIVYSILKEKHSRSDGTTGNVSREGVRANGIRQGTEEITPCDKKPETSAGPVSYNNFLSQGPPYPARPPLIPSEASDTGP